MNDSIHAYTDIPDFDREPLPSEQEEYTKKMIDHYLWLLLVEGRDGSTQES